MIRIRCRVFFNRNLDKEYYSINRGRYTTFDKIQQVSRFLFNVGYATTYRTRVTQN